ncbi:MAG: type ISP restriction/modification enzyme, partial [Gemmatimonadota bacterium]
VLWQNHSPQQIYLVSLLTHVLGEGPAAMATELVPDMDYFRGSFGAKHVIPLWRNANATLPNIATGLVDVLSTGLGVKISHEDLFAYSYALLSTPAYVSQFSDELEIPGPRIPVTKGSSLFVETVELGRRLIWLHTFGDRFGPRGNQVRGIPQGIARCTRAVPADPENYPDAFSYDASSHRLLVGEGVFDPVSIEVYEFSISGFRVVHSWLSSRMKSGAGKKSSPLDDIRPDRWTADFTEELLHLLWILEATIALYPQLERNLTEVIEGEVFTATEFPQPFAADRKPPTAQSPEQLTHE